MCNEIFFKFCGMFECNREIQPTIKRDDPVRVLRPLCVVPQTFAGPYVMLYI
jgi:hypothetical protein